MLEKLSKLKRRKKITSGGVYSAKETLYKHWHIILLLYAICNVLFIAISISILGGVTFSAGADAADTLTPQARSFEPSVLEPSMQLQRYKSLVESGVIVVDDQIDL